MLLLNSEVFMLCSAGLIAIPVDNRLVFKICRKHGNTRPWLWLIRIPFSFTSGDTRYNAYILGYATMLQPYHIRTVKARHPIPIANQVNIHAQLP
jgi:hypothetical protein